MPASAVTKLPYRVKDLTSLVFGRLTVIEFSHSQKYKGGARAIWKCLCRCGKTTFVRGGNLQSGNTTSCECAHRDKMTKHGHAASSRNGKPPSSLYSCWVSMKNRCESRQYHGYSHYGGRGISICERWRNSFVNFLADVGERPGPEYSLDRIDNDGDYEPGNVRWATARQQRRNSRNRFLSDEEIAKAIKLRQQGKTHKAIGKLLGVNETSIRRAIKREANKDA